jgi:hypothetical protein
VAYRHQQLERAAAVVVGGVGEEEFADAKATRSRGEEVKLKKIVLDIQG